MTNGKQNSAAAMDFLRGLKTQKNEPIADLTAKIVFSKPTRQEELKTRTKPEAKLKNGQPGNVGGAIRMEEYVVGAKPRSRARVQRGSLDIKKRMFLNEFFLNRDKINGEQ